MKWKETAQLENASLDCEVTIMHGEDRDSD